MLAASLLLGTLAGSSLAKPYVTEVSPMSVFSLGPSCGNTGLSCHNTSMETNLCCFESPGGLLLQTQFWDTDPSSGPTDSWTIHGLWPDNCDGTFVENCDPSRAYTDIAGLLESQGASDTLDFMNTYWVDIDGQNEQFWEHEWRTHGTCYSTLEPSCLPDDSPTGAEAVAFFKTVTSLFQKLPTYDWLASAGITPNNRKSYRLSTIVDALRDAAGVTPALDCERGSLNQISWYFNLKGSLIDGEFVPVDAPEKGSCKSSHIRYPTKSSS